MRLSKFLITEAFGGYEKLSANSDSDDEIDLNPDDTNDEVDLNPDDTNDEVDLNPESESTDKDILSDIDAKATEDPNHQGLIRTIQKAHLIYKREQEDGTFQELWIYNIGNIKTDLVTKKAILAGTDIPPNRMKSPDGEQECTIWAIGNAELLHIKGLPQ